MNTTNEDDWDDFLKMFCDMKRHNHENNYSDLFEEDDLINKKMRWVCGKTGKSWSIKINKVYEFIKNHELNKNSDLFNFVHLLNKCLNTVEGRKQLSSFLNNK